MHSDGASAIPLPGQRRPMCSGQASYGYWKVLRVLMEQHHRHRPHQLSQIRLNVHPICIRIHLSRKPLFPRKSFLYPAASFPSTANICFASHVGKRRRPCTDADYRRVNEKWRQKEKG